MTYKLGYVTATVLVALGVCMSYAAIEGAVCETDCSSYQALPQVFLVVAVISFLAASVVGRRAYRRDRVEHAGGSAPVGYAVFVMACIPFFGFVLAALALAALAS